MTGRVEGKVVLVSGGARGQGLAHGELLARSGAKVVIGDVLDDVGEGEVEKLRRERLAIRYVHLDVTEVRDWDAAVEVAQAEFGCLDVLVNNAGICSIEGIDETTMDVWNRILAVDQTGVFYGMRAALPALLDREASSIVNISSTNGIVAGDGWFAYHAAKAAVVLMTKNVAVTYAHQGLRANAVCPNYVLTEMMEQDRRQLREKGRDARLEAYLAGTPMGRFCRPEEVSELVLFLASDESSYITGAVVPIDGGYLAQ